MEVGSALDPDGIGQKLKSKVSLVSVRTYQGEIEEIGNSSSGRSSAGQKKSIALLAASKGLTGNRLTEDDSYTRKERSAASKQIETTLIVQTNMPSASSTSSQNPLHGKKILIADDDKVQKRIATMTLSKMGAALVETCNNGKEALELVCKNLRDQALQGSVEPPYHCILMDCQMPEMNGFEATRRIRIEEAKYDIRIPIFALTAHGTGEISDQMFEVGMDAHLERPLRLHQLVEAMGSLN